MYATDTLPQGYRQFDHIDLQKDKKTALILNIAAVVFFFGLLALGHFAFVPFSSVWDQKASDSAFWAFLMKVGVFLALYIAYIVLHELTHAAAMKLFKAKGLRFGFTGLYAFAGSETDYFAKAAYRVIALAPLIVWTILLTVPLCCVPSSWFWVFYLVQCGNLAGCAGDIYVTVRLWHMPKDILVRDTGVEMFVYSRRSRSGYLQRTKKI